MELLLQTDLPHQQAAVEAVSGVFENVGITPPKLYYENPIVDISGYRIQSNVKDIQIKNRLTPDSVSPRDGIFNIDVKMETGTGKTYVYTKTIYELHAKYGINKFIILVPSLAIKAGTAGFISDSYVKRHFSDVCGYNTEIELNVVEALKAKKKGHSYFPYAVKDFVDGSCQTKNKIYVLLCNMQLLTSGKLLKSDDYDNSAAGCYCPFDALKAVKPFVIIDEPHRFSRQQAAFKAIVDRLAPQCIIRFGATFPETKVGKGKTEVKDYQNLVYNLDACAAFNNGLIKGVAKEHFEPLSKREDKIKITKIVKNDYVNFQYVKRISASNGSAKSTKSFTLRNNDSLSVIDENFHGINIISIENGKVTFSNGLTKCTGEALTVDVYMTSYQEQMMKLALQRHFETERANFSGRDNKIKTLALFFIDSRDSYRKNENEKEPFLLNAFERLLKEQINNTLSNLSNSEEEYADYLKASLDDISACHEGYFDLDNESSDKEIASQVDEILHGKKQLISFKNENGSYNTRRFVFSKWTLKEGWDNPNVFTIAKLRSSGSEISRLQEVGRGLRLPVDEFGNRISDEDFKLNYIVDFEEADFAQRLIKEINSDNQDFSEPIPEEKLRCVAEKLGKTDKDLFMELLSKNYVDVGRRIIPECSGSFFGEYPDFAVGLKSNKVEDRNNDRKKATVKIRPKIYNELRELWEKLNQKYLLFYDEDVNQSVIEAVYSIFVTNNIFADMIISSDREELTVKDGKADLNVGTGVQYKICLLIKYGEFLRRVSQLTSVPITAIHSAVCKYSKEKGAINKNHFNENTVAAFCSAFKDWKIKNLQGRFRYSKSKIPLGATALTYPNGNPKPDISQGRIGRMLEKGTAIDKYLYEEIAYDSPKELENITKCPERITVYGKIPTKSIMLPTIVGETYSPDFMYVVKRADGTSDINIVVETKDYDADSSYSDIEKAKISCAELFFEILKKEGYDVHYEKQLRGDNMAKIIQAALGNPGK